MSNMRRRAGNAARLRRIKGAVMGLLAVLLIAGGGFALPAAAEEAAQTVNAQSENAEESSDTAQGLTLTKGEKIAGFLVIFTIVFVATAVVSTGPARKRLKQQRQALEAAQAAAKNPAGEVTDESGKEKTDKDKDKK